MDYPQLRPRRYQLTPIAHADVTFADFGPYVASIDDAGRVAFQTTLRAGGTAVCIGDGKTVETVAESGPSVAEFTSHPDIDARGALSVYARLRSGAEAVVVAAPEDVRIVTRTGAELVAIGPAGPVSNSGGAVTFRATMSSGEAAMFLEDDTGVRRITEPGLYTALHGLPAVNAAGDVAFRADDYAGAQAVHLWRDGHGTRILELGETYLELGRFPFLTESGVVVCTAVERGGRPTILASIEGMTQLLLPWDHPFTQVRGALVGGDGALVFYAAPPGGTLGLYAGLDPVADRLLGLGDSLAGSKIVDFALNPVSVNCYGQLAIRLALADGQQWVLRADP